MNKVSLSTDDDQNADDNIDASMSYPHGSNPNEDDDDLDFDMDDGGDDDGGDEMGGDDGGDEMPDDGDLTNDDNIDLEPLNDPAGDVSMTELLCDLLGALGVQCEHSPDEGQFKRNLYNAAMTKIHELVGKAQSDGDEEEVDPTNRDNPPGQPPNNPKPKPVAPGQQNPLIQQEQQPMFMSLDEINKLPDPMRGVALAMYKENQKLRKEVEADRKKLDSLNDRTLRDEDAKRQQRVALLGKLAPRAKGMLDQMLANPAMALSMGENGKVNDPMATTLNVLEKGLADMPNLLTTEAAALNIQPHPTDADTLSEERIDDIADGFARQMGCPPARAG